MSFLNPLTVLARLPHQNPSAEYLAKRDSDLANAEGALLSLYQELEEYRSALYHEQSIREQMEAELFRRDSEIKHLVQTIQEMQEEEGKGERRRTTIETLRRERELEEKVKFLESKLWNSKIPYPEGNKFGLELEQQVVSFLEDPDATSTAERKTDINMELDDFRQRYSALAMQVKIAKEEILQRDSTIQSLERKCKRLEEKEMKAQAELMSLTDNATDEMEAVVKALEQENLELKDRIFRLDRSLEMRDAELQTLNDDLKKSKKCYMELQREFNSCKDQLRCSNEEKEGSEIKNQLSKFELLAEKRRLEVEGLQSELETSMKRYLQLQREYNELKDQYDNDIQEVKQECREEILKYERLSETLQSEIQNLQKNLVEEKEQCRQLSDATETLQQEAKEQSKKDCQRDNIDEIQKSKEKLEAQLFHVQSEISLWKNQVDILKQTCHSLEDEMSETIAERDSLRNATEILQNEVHRLDQELKDALAQLNTSSRALEESNDGRVTTIDLIMQENKKMAEEIRHLKSSGESNQKEALALIRASLQSELASNTALRDQTCFNIATERYSMETEVELGQRAVALREKEITKLKTQNEEIQHELDGAHDTLRRYQRELTEAKVQLEEYSIKMSAKERSIEHANSELQYYQTQVSDLRKELVDQKYRYEDLSKEFNLLKAESERLHFLQEINEQLEQDLDSAEEQLDLLQQKMEEARSKASIEIGEQANSVDELAKQNNILAIELDAAYKKISNIESELAAQNRRFKTAEMIRDEHFVHMGSKSFTEGAEFIERDNLSCRQKGKCASTYNERWTIMKPMIPETSAQYSCKNLDWLQLRSHTGSHTFDCSENVLLQDRIFNGKDYSPVSKSRYASKKQDFVVF